MATRIQSNYLFNANGFLDSRQGKASNLQDLLNWDFEKDILPVGFEVCVNGDWYTYDPTYSSVKSGKFKPRTSFSSDEESGEIPSLKGIIYEGNILGEV